MRPLVNYPESPPEGRFYEYVPFDHPFMVLAAAARAECAGDPVYPVGIVLVKNDVVIARAGNGFNRGPGEAHYCPRLLARAKSGEGYELCGLHDPVGHAERMVMKVCAEKRIDPSGADAYMSGHWWACTPCWQVLIAGEIARFFLVDDAHVRFSRENVYRETLRDYPEDIRRFYGAM